MEVLITPKFNIKFKPNSKEDTSDIYSYVF